MKTSSLLLLAAFAFTTTAARAQTAFKFPTVVGRSYQFEFSLNLATGIWTPIDGPLPGTGGTVTHIIGPVTGQPQLFFRIRTGP